MSDTKLREKADALIAFTQQGPRFIAWVEAVTDSIAPAPEKVAKVETMADRIAADLKAGTFRGEQPAPPAPEKAAKVECPNCGEMTERSHSRYEGPGPDKWACQPAPPEPAAREMPEALSKALGRLAYCASSPHETDDWMEETLAIRTALESLWRNLAQADPEYLVAVGKAIAAVRQKAAQPRRMELGKVRAYFNTPFALRTVGDEREALAELDAAEGKVAG